MEKMHQTYFTARFYMDSKDSPVFNYPTTKLKLNYPSITIMTQILLQIYSFETTLTGLVFFLVFWLLFSFRKSKFSVCSTPRHPALIGCFKSIEIILTRFFYSMEVCFPHYKKNTSRIFTYSEVSQ